MLREVGLNRLLVECNKLGEPYTISLNRIARGLLASLREDATKSEFVFRSIVTGLNLTEIKAMLTHSHRGSIRRPPAGQNVAIGHALVSLVFPASFVLAAALNR